MAYVSASMLVEELREFTSEQWIGEPPDVTRLRTFTLPPMKSGNGTKLATCVPLRS